MSSWLSEVCNDDCVEPHLQPLSGEVLTGDSANTEEGARLDIAANSFWGGHFERAYFDVRVFNPHAPSNRQQSLPATYRTHERAKVRAYEQRVREVEHGSFTPPCRVSHWWGWTCCQATTCFKRLASLLSEKWDQSYSSTLAWLRCTLSFALLRSSIQCLWGACSAAGRPSRKVLLPVDLVLTEAGFDI